MPPLFCRHNGTAAIIRKRLLSFCWFSCKWGLVACVVAAALLVPYFYHRMDEGIRGRAEEMLAKHYPGLRIKLHSAVLMKGEGIALRGLSIIDPTAEGPGAELLSYDECFLACSTDLADLLSGQVNPTRVIIRRPTLRMTRRPDGSWSAARLLPFPNFSDGPLPEIRFENGTIEVFDPTRTVACTFTLRNVNLALAPLALPAGQSPATRLLQIEGTAAGDHFRQVIFNGKVDPDRPALDLAGNINGVEISPKLRGVLSDAFGCDLSMLGSLRGQTEVHFNVAYDPALPQRWQFDVTGQLAGGRIDDPRLPHALTEINATVRVDNQGFAIRPLKARCGQASLTLTCSGSLSPSSPLDVEAEVIQLPLDAQLPAILPPKFQKAWQRLWPEGVVDASIRLRYDGRDWQPRVRIKCRDVSFAHEKFRYRLEHGNGLLDLADDHLTMNLSTMSDNKWVQIAGEIDNVASGPSGWLQVHSDELPIDEKLLKALPAHAQSLARSMDLRGVIGFTYRLSRKAFGEPEHQHLELCASDCDLRYRGFPYALSKVRGEIVMDDGNWRFSNLVGYNGTTCVSGTGALLGTPRGDELTLSLSAARVPLEADLHNALPEEMRQVWGLLQPRGVIDIAANIRYVDQLNLLDVAVWARPQSETCSIEPVQFPYRLENVQGVFTYSGGQLAFDRFSAWHGPVKMACDGTCSFQPGGGWQLRLDHLAVDRLRMDRQFVQALPPQIKKGLGDLNATGPMSLQGRQGSIVVARGANRDAPTIAQWTNLRVGLNQVGVDCGVRMENIYGNIDLSGWTDGTRFQMRGEVGFESLTYRDHQLTQVMGPFWIDEQQALFGSLVARRDNQALPPGQTPAAARSLTARVFGGIIDGDGWVLFGAQQRYNVWARLFDADLATCARELTGNNRNLRGRIRGGVELGGIGRSRTAMSGKGSLHLHDANIYELPAMVSMLKILSIKMPDPNAFSQSDIDFRIQGEHVYFDKLDFKGDAISLSGKGEMNFQGDTHMVLVPTVGHADAGLPLLHNFFRALSQQIMQIRVSGNLQNPDIRQEAMPGVNQALKSLQENQ